MPLLRSLGPDRCNEHRVVLNALRPDDVGRDFELRIKARMTDRELVRQVAMSTTRA